VRAPTEAAVPVAWQASVAISRDQPKDDVREMRLPCFRLLAPSRLSELRRAGAVLEKRTSAVAGVVQGGVEDAAPLAVQALDGPRRWRSSG
jgi:hypothetical protein